MISIRIAPALLAAGLLLTARLGLTQPAMSAATKGGMMEPAKSEMKPMKGDGMATMTPGLQVGAKAPDFVLKDASGKDVSLQSLLTKGKVALAFYRSADWCP